MPIDPLITETVRVGQLPPAPFNLTDPIPHEVADELFKGTVQELADTIGAYLGAIGGLAFNPTAVPDGGTLPATTTNEFILVGRGTFHNVGGEPDIITTEELNVLTSNGSYWSLSVAIPIDVELAGITQNIRNGYTETVPSESAVFNALVNKLSLGGYVGTAQDLFTYITVSIQTAIKKAEKEEVINTDSGVVDVVFPDDRAVMVFTGTVTEVQTVGIYSTNLYLNKKYYFKNSQATDIILKHDSGPGGESSIFLFPNDLDFTLKPNEIIEFLEVGGTDLEYVGSIPSSLGYTPVPESRTIEINGVAQDLSANRTWTVTSGIAHTTKTATSVNLTTQDVAGFLAYVNGVTSFAIAANEIVKYHITDTGQIFEISVNSRSVGSGETALTSSDVLEIKRNFTTIKRNDFSILLHSTYFQPSRLVEGAGPLLTTVGTADDSGTGPSYPGTSYSRWVRRRYVSAATAGATVSHSTGSYRLIDLTLSGQFLFSTHVGNEDASAVATGRTFFGFYSGAVPNSDPSVLGDAFGLGNDSADTTMQIIHNDNTGTATKINLGANFPANTVSSDHYLFQVWKYAGSPELHYYVKNLNNGAETAGKVSTDLPASGYYIAVLNRNNGVTAAAVKLAASHLQISENR